jgi:isopentenyl diphosphate isomerase/L-lactate dehydrogenase-like FMN-dependent dehydrogenase
MEPINVQDYERLARERLSPGAWAYFSSGSDDEVTLREERAAFERLRLLPRVLRGLSSADLRTTVLGTPVRMPILVCPTGLHVLAHPEGELATARAAGEAGTLMTLSTVTTRTLEEVAAVATGPLWFQLYVYRGARDLAEGLVHRAERAGYRAILLTVDAPRFGNRERGLRAEASLPPDLRFAHFEGAYAGAYREPEALSWEDVAWLRSVTELPILLKGVLHPEDAAHAVEHGASGVIVSTHGGRQLDAVPASIEALPAVVEAVGQRAEVYLDGGMRRGTDVLKALALGAQAVFVGRPVLWGLAVGGAAGVRGVLELLREELELAMVLAGASGVQGVGPDLLWKGQLPFAPLLVEFSRDDEGPLQADSPRPLPPSTQQGRAGRRGRRAARLQPAVRRRGDRLRQPAGWWARRGGVHGAGVRHLPGVGLHARGEPGR